MWEHWEEREPQVGALSRLGANINRGLCYFETSRVILTIIVKLL